MHKIIIKRANGTREIGYASDARALLSCFAAHGKRVCARSAPEAIVRLTLENGAFVAREVIYDGETAQECLDRWGIGRPDYL